MNLNKASVLDEAQNYFSNINPIATRIYADFEETKSSYECVWKTLSLEEQSQILNECIIKPEITLQYSLKPSALSDKTPKSDSFALKRVVDDSVSYRDEHSAPFSFKTLSQVDLRLFGREPSRKIHVTPKLDPPKLQSPPPPSNPPPTRYTASLLGKLLGRSSQYTGRENSPGGCPDEYEALVSPQSPDTTAETAETSTEGDEDTFTLDGLPKTGLDFLDNW